MVSLRKYLEMSDPSSPAHPAVTPDSVSGAPLAQLQRAQSGRAQPEHGAALARLCSTMLERLGSGLLPEGNSQGDGNAGGNSDVADLRLKIEQAKALVSPSAAIAERDVLLIEETVAAVLSGYLARNREAARRTAIETQQVVGVLNDALLALTGGSQRSLSRLHRIQESLSHTSMIRDAGGLRASLAEAVKLIREESIREEEQAARDIASFEAQVVGLRQQLAANPLRRLAGRGEAIQALSDGLRRLTPGTGLYAVAFLLTGLKAIVNRYGSEPVEELFLQIVRERVQPLAEVNTSSRWSPACVVSVFESPSTMRELQSVMAKTGKEPLVYRMTLGNRTAALKVGLAHLALTVTPESLNSVVAEIDRFGGTEASHAA